MTTRRRRQQQRPAAGRPRRQRRSRIPSPATTPRSPARFPGSLPCACGTTGPTCDDCLGTDMSSDTGDDTLGNCVVDATPTYPRRLTANAPLAPLTPPITRTRASGRTASTAPRRHRRRRQRRPLGRRRDHRQGADQHRRRHDGDSRRRAATTSSKASRFRASRSRWAIYGGVQPHDSSGIVPVHRRCAMPATSSAHRTSSTASPRRESATAPSSITTRSTANFDDGFEWFGGTVTRAT